MQYVYDDVEDFRRGYYCIILNLLKYTIQPLQTAGVFLFQIISKQYFKKIKQNERNS